MTKVKHTTRDVTLSQSKNTKNILVTGGAGYIGIHCCKNLIDNGYNPIILDNLSHSEDHNLEGLKKLTGIPPTFIAADIRDTDTVERTLTSFNCHAIIHLAALKSVPNGELNPDTYHSNNVDGSASVITAMENVGVKHIVFSSSSTVYATPKKLPVTETHPLAPINVYGQTKLSVEKLLRNFCEGCKERSAISLRYFNPVGAHPSGLIGEAWSSASTNLVPRLAGVALKKMDDLEIYGSCYDTRDGTCIRDYLHVLDLVDAHIAALNNSLPKGFQAINLGSGKGTTVLEIVDAYQRASGKKINLKIGPARQGDVPIYFADANLAKQQLKWQTRYTLEQMCKDDWNFQMKHFNNN